MSTKVKRGLGLLVVAALGGFYLASIHLRGVVAPRTIVYLHAGLAVVGFLTLVSAVWMHLTIHGMFRRRSPDLQGRIEEPAAVTG